MIKYTAVSDTGRYKEKNEDSYMLPPDDDELCLDLGFLFVVCDGLGGYAGGEIASQKIAAWFREYYYFQLQLSEHPLQKMVTLLEMTSDKLMDFKSSNPFFAAMSTTFTAVVFYGHSVWVVSVGDSRVYRFRKGKLSQVSEDHSLVWDLYKEGTIAKHELATHRHANVVTSAIGLNEDYDVFSAELKSNDKDIYLLCTDGLSDVLTDAEIEAALKQTSSLKKQSQLLIDKVNEKGAKDNVTFTLVQLS